MTLDLDMPRMHGVEFIKHLMPQFPLPTLIISSSTKRGQKSTLDALESGAVDFVTKPFGKDEHGLEKILNEICEKVKMVPETDVSFWKGRSDDEMIIPQKSPSALTNSDKFNDKVIVIGASTGGVKAVRYILSSLPASIPGIVVVQQWVRMRWALY